jgi:hypothetical protein
MIEHRRSRRKPTQHNIEVTDAIAGEVIGFVGNLSIDGMLLIANRALPDDALFQLKFELPGHAGVPAHRFEIGVHEQWGEPTNIPGKYWAGFRIIDIGAEDRAALAAWLNAQEEHNA